MFFYTIRCLVEAIGWAGIIFAAWMLIQAVLQSTRND